jgi:GNAT superfamily N-acetyltransferase
MTTKIAVEPLTPDRWPDLEAVFGGRGCSVARGCWCMHYRLTGSGLPVPAGKSRSQVNRAALEKLARSGRPPGLIAYRDAAPVGWVSVGPREDYLRLARSPVMKPVDDEKVWSIVCFVVPSEHRRQGVARALLDGAVAWARTQGAKLVEAYPVDRKGAGKDEDLWFGTKSMYDRAGFREVARRKPRRPVVRLALSVLFALAAALPARAADAAGDRILGEWRGTSTCTNRELAPACKDETVRYVFTRREGTANGYHQVAEKLVSGSFEVMGEMDFDYSEADGTWSHTFDARTCPRCTWWYRLDGGKLVGGLASASGETLRKAEAERPRP